MKDINLSISLASLVLVFFGGHPAVETLFSTFKSQKWQLDKDWKYFAAQAVVITMYPLLFLHAYEGLLIIATYWDLTDRMLKFSCEVLQHVQTPLIRKIKNLKNIREIQTINTEMSHICRTFAHTKIVNRMMKEIIETFVGIFIIIVLPFLMILVYVTLRLGSRLNSSITMSAFVLLLIWCYMSANIYICASSLYDQSNRFIQIGRKKSHFFKAALPYWELKFCSFFPIKVEACGCFFSNAHLLPAFSQFAHKSCKLLLL